MDNEYRQADIRQVHVYDRDCSSTYSIGCTSASDRGVLRIYLPDKPVPLGRYTYFGIKIDGKELPALFHLSEVYDVHVSRGMHQIEIRQMAYGYRKQFDFDVGNYRDLKFIVIGKEICLADETGLKGEERSGLNIWN